MIKQIKLAHKEWAFDERQKLFTWTNRMSFVISAVVHIVLVVGLWAAIREFQQASRTRKRQKDQTEINVSAEGVALKTSLHGTLLLVTCIGLYFLYLRFIYPINGS